MPPAQSTLFDKSGHRSRQTEATSDLNRPLTLKKVMAVARGVTSTLTILKPVVLHVMTGRAMIRVAALIVVLTLFAGDFSRLEATGSECGSPGINVIRILTPYGQNPGAILGADPSRIRNGSCGRFQEFAALVRNGWRLSSASSVDHVNSLAWTIRLLPTVSSGLGRSPPSDLRIYRFQLPA